MRSPDVQPVRPASFHTLIVKEWRDVLAGHTLWILLFLLSLLVGYSYMQAVILYGEASRSAAQLPEVARGLSPLDGIFVPTFGALYLANTFLLPFVAIRAIASEKQTGSLKLLLQLPCSLSTILSAKLLVLAAVWLLVAMPCASTVVLWSASGGHIGWAELANLLLGHALYAAVVIAIAVFVGVLAESGATAAILALAATMAFWVLDFAASGDSGLLKSLSNLSLTTLLRGFEQGLFSSSALFGALIASAALITIAGIWLDLRRTQKRKIARSGLAVIIACSLAAAAGFVPLYIDTTENRRNSFPPADTATLRALDRPLNVLVHLAPQDPRYIDFERNILGKLRRSLRKFTVTLQSETRSGVFEASDQYGLMVYRYDGKQAESRSTGAGEVLPLIYGLAGIERKTVPERQPYPGYPLQAGNDVAQVWFYGLLPLLIIIAWSVAHQGYLVSLKRARQPLPADIIARRPFKET